MHISKYVYKTCLKELVINTGKPLKKRYQKNIAAPNISEYSALLIFLSYFKKKYLLEHVTMVTFGNVTKYGVFQ